MHNYITFFSFLSYIFSHSQTVPLRYFIVNLVKFASCCCVQSFVHGCSKVGNGILNLEWECSDFKNGTFFTAREEQLTAVLWLCARLVWNGTFFTEREEQLTGVLWLCARLFWFAKFAHLLSI